MEVLLLQKSTSVFRGFTGTDPGGIIAPVIGAVIAALSDNSCSKILVYQLDRIYHFYYTFQPEEKDRKLRIVLWPSTTLCLPLEKCINVF
jgi:hypothetical protein